MPDILKTRRAASSPTNFSAVHRSVRRLLRRSAVRQAAEQTRPDYFQLFRLYGFGISRTNVDRRRAPTPTTPRCTSAEAQNWRELGSL